MDWAQHSCQRGRDGCVNWGLTLAFYQRWQYIAVHRFWQRKAGVASALHCIGNQQHKSLYARSSWAR